MRFLTLVTTVGSQAEARAIAKALVDRGLAACAQISAIESFYTWNGAVANEPEFRVLFKTKAALYETAAQAIRELHSYQLPAIHACAIERIDEAYGAWIESACHAA